MDHFFKYSIYEYPEDKFLVNPVRVVQAFLCMGCLGLAAYLIVEESLLYLSFKVILGVTAASFTTITIIDIISNSHYDPIHWSTWIMFAMTGALFFFTCTGLLLATYTGVTPNLVIGEILFGVTGIMFLIDALYILCLRKKQQSEVFPDRTFEQAVVTTETRSQTRSATPASGHVSEEETVQKRYGPQYGVAPQYVSQYEAQPSAATARGPQPRKPGCRCPHTTTYGGTFAMSKDATPLPSPTPVIRQVCKSPAPIRSRRVGASPSQTEKGIYPGPDGRMLLCDGTPLIPMQTETGELWYKSPDGTAYTSDGVPLASQKTKPKRNSGRIYQTPDGKISLSDGTIVKPIKNRRSEVIYKSADGVLYTSEGIPLASSPERIAKLEAEHLGKDLELTQEGIKASVEKIVVKPAEIEMEHIVEEKQQRSRGRSADKVNEATPRRHSSQRNMEHRVIDKSVESVKQARQGSTHKSGRSSPNRSSSKERSLENFAQESSPNSAKQSPLQTQEHKVRPNSGSAQIIVEKRFSDSSTPQTTTESRDRSVERSKLGEPNRIIETTVKERTVENMNYYPGILPSCLREKCPEECPRDCHPFEAEHGIKEVIVPCPARNQPQTMQRITVEKRQYEQREIVTVKSSDSNRTPKQVNSRTVAVSTRMVPKTLAARDNKSAPGTVALQKQAYYRPAKSADYVVQSDSYKEDYHPVNASQTVVICSPAQPCGNANCTWCRDEIPGYAYQPPSKLHSPVRENFQSEPEPTPEVTVPPHPLQTISECECETDQSSTWEQDQVFVTPSDFSSGAPTSRETVPVSFFFLKENAANYLPKGAFIPAKFNRTLNAPWKEHAAIVTLDSIHLHKTQQSLKPPKQGRSKKIFKTAI